jgi:hypothetical protein
MFGVGGVLSPKKYLIPPSGQAKSKGRKTDRV